MNYLIDVTLNEQEKSIDAFEKITYINNSPDTLPYIWFHLWPNAYKNDRTAFSDQLLLNGKTDFYFADKEKKGYINRLDFKVDGSAAKTEDHPQYIDVTKVLLPKPLPPGEQAVITTPFHVKLPFNFSRGGYDGQSFQLTQWYPKPAVYDRNGWHPMPYLDQGEFYSEFGSFDVRITTPKTYVVAATGLLQNWKEIYGDNPEGGTWQEVPQTSFQQKPIKKIDPPYKGKITAYKKAPIQQKTLIENVGTVTRVYKQDNVHDFAWFADKSFIVDHDTCTLSSGRVIEVMGYYKPTDKDIWKNAVGYAKDAVRFYSKEVGEYPYNIVQVVEGPQSFGGGMEYPTITIIAQMPSAKQLDITIAHEIGHNWFYGILASNERDHPWMDEGINSYYEYKYQASKYGEPSKLTELLFQAKAINHTDQPIETTSELFSEENYNLVAYHKTAEWMKELEQTAGKESFNQMMHEYYNNWKFRHPQPENYKEIASTTLNGNTDSLFKLLNGKGILPGNQLTGFAFISPLIKESIKAFFFHPKKNVLILSPAPGYNSYDKLMIGAVASNYMLPPKKFQYLIIPLYGTGSKSFNGLGKLNYSIKSDGRIRKTDFFVNASTFSINEFTDSAGRKMFMHFEKLVPGFRLTFKQKDPRSTVYRYLQWKTYFLNEQRLRIIPDTIVRGTDTSFIKHYQLPADNRFLNQLQFVYENNRALYPFDIQLQVEQAKDFIRPALTANYFFNYSKGGGLQLRLFAGKFIYLNGRTLSKQFKNDRYLLNMTGANGYEDYTYNEYFIGRNKFQGFASQQIMIRDGGFKVRTDLLSDKIGKTDDWLMAANFVTSVPSNLNPLSVLPVKVPLRLFADIGTYAGPWKQNSSLDRFLYDAGVNIPLFADMINIYVPLLYSKAYRDYFKSAIPENRFWKTISFSVNLYNPALKKANRSFEFL